MYTSMAENHFITNIRWPHLHSKRNLFELLLYESIFTVLPKYSD